MLERVRQTEPERTSPLGAWSGWDGRGVTLRERRGLAVVELAAYGRGEASRETLGRALGIALPGAGGSMEAAGVAALSIGPGRWLLVGSEAALAALPTPAEDAAALTDLSHGRTILTLAGPNAARTLAKGTAIDVNATALPNGAVAATALARIPAVIWRRGAAYDIMVPRTYAKSLLDWLVAAGASG